MHENLFPVSFQGKRQFICFNESQDFPVAKQFAQYLIYVDSFSLVGIG